MLTGCTASFRVDLRLLGLTLPLFPISLPLTGRQSGLLAPQFAFGAPIGFTYAQPVFFTLGPSNDVTITPGFLSGLLGFRPLGYVEASLPILMFCVLFGVSMDYQVFLLSRIMEAYGESGDNRASVADGLERSGGVITSAAAIIVLVAGSFVAADVILIKALGFGTALAVLLDATLVRALVVPATMRLLGRWNWWLPRRLASVLPSLGLETEPELPWEESERVTAGSH